MAESIQETIVKAGKLVVEAGTGTGKTLAYLVPALASGGKVIVSTGTKTLQDQLFERDIPLVRAALGVPVTVALLKGRSNYVCHYRLVRARERGHGYGRRELRWLEEIARFAERSDSGDKAHVRGVPEEAAIWADVTSTRDNCLGQDCPHFDRCFVMEARRKALAADVVVVNHHLFLADLALKEEGMAELLPAANTVVFDEAHQLPELAGLFFGLQLTARQLLELARDSRAEILAHAPESMEALARAEELEQACRRFRLALPREGWRSPWTRAKALPGFEAAWESLSAGLQNLHGVLQAQAERAPTLAQCAARAERLTALLSSFGDAAGEGADEDRVHWVEAGAQSFSLHATPLSSAPHLKGHLLEGRAWIFTSATLSVKGDFGHYQELMGLADARCASFDSPFDYARQALLYVPEGLPDPNSPDYTRAVVAASLPVLAASGGRAFLLFTSLRAMYEAQDLLASALAEQGLEFPLFVQGQGPKNELLARFRRAGNAVLLGAQSFWEGVDVPGAALSLVIIDRLPFANPDDPVLAARIERMNREGRNAFMDYQLPHAVLTLKQGAGRLIRSEGDRGVLMICDPRLIDKPYGRRIWQSLPPMRRSRRLADVRAFFEERPNDVAAL